MSTVFPIIKRPRLADLPNNRHDLLYLAMLAASGRRFEHMYDYMKRLVQIVAPTELLAVQERKYFSWACYALITEKHDAYNYVRQIAARCAGIDQKRGDSAKAYMPIMAEEIDAICKDVLKLINVNFLDPVSGLVRSKLPVEPMMFYTTIKGDFLRFRAQVNTGSEKLRLADEAYRSYQSAVLEEGGLPTTNPTRLETRLRFAHFLCDVYQKPDEGYKTAHKGYQLAMRDVLAAGEQPSGELANSLDRLQNFLSNWHNYAT